MRRWSASCGCPANSTSVLLTLLELICFYDFVTSWLLRRPANCGLFVVCDGHNGVTAAQYVADQLPAYLDDLLPLGEPPDESDAKAFLLWRQGLQRALTISLALLHRAFAGQGVLAGCTVTIVLQVGSPLNTLACTYVCMLHLFVSDFRVCIKSLMQSALSQMLTAHMLICPYCSTAGYLPAPTWATHVRSWTPVGRSRC